MFVYCWCRPWLSLVLVCNNYANPLENVLIYFYNFFAISDNYLWLNACILFMINGSFAVYLDYFIFVLNDGVLLRTGQDGRANVWKVQSSCLIHGQECCMRPVLLIPFFPAIRTWITCTFCYFSCFCDSLMTGMLYDGRFSHLLHLAVLPH